MGQHQFQQPCGKLIREGSRDVKESFETLLQGGSIAAEIDEQVVYSMLGGMNRRFGACSLPAVI